MKKKIVSILLIAVMAVAGLTACGAPEGGQSQQQNSGSVQAEEGSDDGAAQTAGGVNMISEDLMGSAPAEGADFSDMKIGEIEYNTLDDGGWSQATHEGVLAAMNELGIPEENLIALDGIEEEPAQVQEAAQQLIDQGCSLIISASTGYAGFLEEVAAANPDVKIAQWDSTKHANLMGYEIRSYEGMFLAGYACELMSQDENTKLGFCASWNEFSVRTAINAYALGAQYANPEATVQVACADSWYDPDKEKQCALTLMSPDPQNDNKGIKYMAMEASSPAIPETCEENGAYVVGYHIDMSSLAPDAVPVSFTWNFAPIFKQMMISVNDGTATADDFYYWGGECSKLTDFASFVPDEVKAQVEELKGKLASGEVNVYSGPLNDNKGNVLVNEGEVMDDNTIILQEFFVEGVDCAWEI